MSADELETELKFYRNITSLESAFDQRKRLKSLGINLDSQGKLKLKRSESGAAEVEWTFEKPAYLRLRITEKNIESFESSTQENGKALLGNQDASMKVLRPLYAWIAMDVAKISAEYDVLKIAKGRFRLEPKQSSPVQAIQMKIGNNQLVEEILLFEKSGDDLRIRFRDSHTEMRK